MAGRKDSASISVSALKPALPPQGLLRQQRARFEDEAAALVRQARRGACRRLRSDENRNALTFSRRPLSGLSASRNAAHSFASASLRSVRYRT